jgi:hypothetical protein
MLNINRYCQFQNKQCLVDGKVLFQHQDATVKQFLSGVYHTLNLDYMKFFKMDALSKLGFLASEVLLDVTNGNTETGLFFANSYSSLDTDAHYQQTIGENYFPSPAVFVYTLPNIVLGEICIRHRIYGENVFLVGCDCQSSHLIQYVEQAFDDSGLKNALVGWLDCYEEYCNAFVMLVSRKDKGSLELNESNVNQLIIKKE